MKIELKNITHYYFSGKQKIQILNNFSIKISKGEFVIIYGPSGCGKTTLLNIIGGLMKPQSGLLMLDNKSYYELSKREQDIIRGKNIGFVFQSYQLIEDLSIIDNILISMNKQNLAKLEKVDLAKQILHNLGLGERLKNRIKDLSGGEQQRIAIARAIAQNANIILCDEPTGNLDEESSQKVIDILCGLKDKGKTIIMVTHNTGFIKYADRRIEMSKSSIVEGGK